MTGLCSDCGREVTAELVELDGYADLAELGAVESFPEDPADVVRAEITATVRYSCNCRDYVDVDLDGTKSNLTGDVPEGWAAQSASTTAQDGGDQ